LKEETTFGSATFGTQLGHFVKQIRNTWKVLKCGGGEG
jgi:hypothetical protein